MIRFSIGFKVVRPGSETTGDNINSRHVPNTKSDERNFGVNRHGEADGQSGYILTPELLPEVVARGPIDGNKSTRVDFHLLKQKRLSSDQKMKWSLIGDLVWSGALVKQVQDLSCRRFITGIQYISPLSLGHCLGTNRPHLLFPPHPLFRARCLRYPMSSGGKS